MQQFKFLLKINSNRNSTKDYFDPIGFKDKEACLNTFDMLKKNKDVFGIFKIEGFEYKETEKGVEIKKILNENFSNDLP